MKTKAEPKAEIKRILKEHGAVLTRQNKHLVWKFPGGQIFTQACTPSDSHAEANQLRDLNALLGLNSPDRGKAGVRSDKAAREVTKKLRAERNTALSELTTVKRQLADMELRAHELDRELADYRATSLAELLGTRAELQAYTGALKDALDRSKDLRAIIRRRGIQIADCQRIIARSKRKAKRLRFHLQSTFGACLKRICYRIVTRTANVFWWGA